MASNNGTNGRVYGGDPDLIHIEDGQRNRMGQVMAESLDDKMREMAVLAHSRTFREAFGDQKQDLCPGCYMVAGFDMMIHLARANGQDLKELGRTMAAAYAHLANCDTAECIESIEVILSEN